MASKREERLRDIKLNERGEYEYTGGYYEIRDESGTGGTLKRLTVMTIALAVAVIGSGLSESEAAIRSFYVILPYVGEATSLFILCWSAVSLISGRGRVRAAMFDRTRGRIAGGATLTMMFALIGCLTSLIYIMKHGVGASAVQTVIYPALKAASAAIAYFMRSTIANMQWNRTE